MLPSGALPTNIRLGWKDLPMANTLACNTDNRTAYSTETEQILKQKGFAVEARLFLNRNKNLYYKSLMIVIYNRNDCGQYYKTTIMIIIYDPS